MVDSLRNVGGRGFLDESEDDDLYTIHGIAIGAGDVTLGSKSGERKYWTEEVLKEGAATLEGKQIVANHENQNIYSVVGKVTDASYSDDKNAVIYQGVVDEELIAKRISRGWLDVSPRIIHTEGEVTEGGLKKPDKIRRFDNLAIVSRGAAPSNEVSMGEAEELSIEELQESFEEPPNFEDPEIEQFDNAELQDNINYKEHLYNSPEAAEGAAQGLGCSGSHKHDIEGATWYMPCDSHDQFLQKLKEQRASENSEGDDNDKDEFVEEFSKKEKENYSTEEMRIASQLSSYSEMTKTECLSIVDMANPSRSADIASIVKILEKMLSDDEREEMKKHMSEEENSSVNRESVLNQIVR